MPRKPSYATLQSSLDNANTLVAISTAHAFNVMQAFPPVARARMVIKTEQNKDSQPYIVYIDVYPQRRLRHPSPFVGICEPYICVWEPSTHDDSFADNDSFSQPTLHTFDSIRTLVSQPDFSQAYAAAYQWLIDQFQTCEQRFIGYIGHNHATRTRVQTYYLDYTASIHTYTVAA